MNKKTKNIVAISIIILLVIGLILTTHFARTSGKIDFDRNMPAFRENIKDTRGKEKSNLPSTKENSIEEVPGNSEEKNDSVKDQTIERDKNRGNRPSGNFPGGKTTTFDKDSFTEKDIMNMPNRANGMPTKYVILLCVETFLLGGSVMYLIMNNIGSDQKEVVVVKEKTAKK